MHSVWKVRPEQVPRETMFWAMKQVSINLKGLNSYKNEFFDQRGIKLEVRSRKISGNPEILDFKNHSLEKNMGQRRNHKIRKYFKINNQSTMYHVCGM